MINSKKFWFAEAKNKQSAERFDNRSLEGQTIAYLVLGN